MAVDVLKQVEALPDAYPDVPSGLSSEAAALDVDVPDDLRQISRSARS